MRTLLALVTTAALGLGLAACAGQPAAATIPEVAITAGDYSFTAPDSVAGGLVRMTMTNTGKEDHHGQLVRLKEGVTVAQFESTLQSALQAVPTEGEAAFFKVFEIVTFMGGLPGAAPGKQSEVVQDLEAGQYVLVCFVPSPDGTPHIAKGMIRPLTVTAATTKRPPEPQAKATVELNNFAFIGVPELAAGKTILKVVNKGTEPHEMLVMRLKGITPVQLQQILSAPPPPPGTAPPGPPPFEFAGGFNGIAPGGSGWTTLDLTPGEYALVCFIPSPANQGKPHLAMGMFTSFTVK